MVTVHISLFKSIWLLVYIKRVHKGGKFSDSLVQLVNIGNQLYFKLFFLIEQVVFFNAD